jgi:hypothetical protein
MRRASITLKLLDWASQSLYVTCHDAQHPAAIGTSVPWREWPYHSRLPEDGQDDEHPHRFVGAYFCDNSIMEESGVADALVRGLSKHLIDGNFPVAAPDRFVRPLST